MSRRTRRTHLSERHPDGVVVDGVNGVGPEFDEMVSESGELDDGIETFRGPPPAIDDSEIPDGPHPVWDILHVDADEVAAVRKLDCRIYPRCLDAAVDAVWPGFSCMKCKAYEPLTEAEQVRQGTRVVASTRAQGTNGVSK